MEDFAEAIGTILFTAFIAYLSWFNACHCRKQRKFYLNNSSEVQGTVTSYNKWVDRTGRSSTAYYDIDVDAYNGETYHISTVNRKARKYRKKTDITLLVPDVCNSIAEDDLIEQFKREQEDMLLNGDENFEKLMEEHFRLRKELLSHLNRAVIIKEDLKSNGEFALSIFFGVLFSAAAVFLIYAYFFMK